MLGSPMDHRVAVATDRTTPPDPMAFGEFYGPTVDSALVSAPRWKRRVWWTRFGEDEILWAHFAQTSYPEVLKSMET